MSSTSFKKAFLFSLLLIVLFIGGWEIYLRSSGYGIAYDDDKVLWSDKRARVYQDPDKATIFIGASRNKHALDIETWRNKTGNDAVQLAIEGTSALPVLDDLASDKDFKGKVVIDVTEGLIFSVDEWASEEPKADLKHYKDRTPAEKASFEINHWLESRFVFLDKFNFSLNGLLRNVRLKNRPGVFTLPYEFPTGISRVSFDRQNIMSRSFETDTVSQNKVKAIWVFFGKYDSPPIEGKKLDSVLSAIKVSTDKIIARGGKIVFVRTPCSGIELEVETKLYPRQKYWERLLQVTQCPGIHFADYPAIDHFVCPENSHLKQSDAIVFTQTLIDILEKEKNWNFPGETNTK